MGYIPNPFILFIIETIFGSHSPGLITFSVLHCLLDDTDSLVDDSVK